MSGWGDACGHVALWNGRVFREPAHDNYMNLVDDPKTTAVREPSTTKAVLWKLKS